MIAVGDQADNSGAPSAKVYNIQADLELPLSQNGSLDMFALK